jgi:hypothetical protein
MPAGRTHRRVIASLVAGAIGIGAWSASAQAATVTVGSPIPGVGNGFLGNNGSTETVANFALGEAGAHVTSPVTGAIVNWRVVTLGTGEYAIRVLRPIGGGNYTGAGRSAQTIPTGGDYTFSASLPIQPGDLVGLDVPDNQGVNGLLVNGSSWSGFIPAVPEGATAAPNPVTTETDWELAFNAVVQYPDPPATTPTPTSKKCKRKKKHKSSAAAAKKKCKKKKHR